MWGRLDTPPNLTGLPGTCSGAAGSVYGEHLVEQGRGLDERPNTCAWWGMGAMLSPAGRAAGRHLTCRPAWQRAS